MKIRKIHYLSGIVISIFTGLHLFNHFISLFGIEHHLDLMDKLRIVYRNMLVESILLIAVLVQVFSGLKLFFAKRKRVSSFFEKLQIWTGLYLAYFLITHVAAVLGARYFLNMDTNFYFGTAGLNTFPFFLFFVPHYGLAILSFFGHLAAIHSQKMKKNIFSITVDQQAKLILCIGFIFTLLIFYGLTNGFTGFEIPAAYNVLIGK